MASSKSYGAVMGALIGDSIGSSLLALPLDALDLLEGVQPSGIVVDVPLGAVTAVHVLLDAVAVFGVEREEVEVQAVETLLAALEV